MTPIQPVPPLVRSKGAEVGVRSTWIPGLNSTLTFWYLSLGQELVLAWGRWDDRAYPSQRALWGGVDQFLYCDLLVDPRF